VDVGDQVAPVPVRERLRVLQHPTDLGRVPVPGQVDPAVAEAARHDQLPGRELEEERTALVRPGYPPLDEREQFVRDHASRHAPLVKRPSDPAVQDVDVGDGRDREAVAAHHAQQLVLLARVVADLADHEGSAAAHLERQLEVLGDQLALEALDVGHGAAEEEGMGARVRHPVGGGPGGGHLAELPVEVEEPDRIHVEHGSGQARVPLDRVVAGDGQHRGQAPAQEVPPQALEPVAVPVAAGHVHDDVVAQLDDRLGRGIR
jgi:hypothetical protein